MHAAKALYSLLTTDAGVSAINAKRVYPGTAKDIKSTAIVYQVIGSPPAGRSVCGTVTDLIETTFQIDCWATKYGQCWELAEAVEAALHDYQSRSSGIERIFITEKVDGFESSEEEFRVTMTVTIYHTGEG